MTEKFRQFVLEKKLFNPAHKILLAVSGGIDSVVMAHLFAEAGFSFGIAHCNFLLRGKESDNDEKFVESLATKLKVPFFVAQIETKILAAKNKFSIQEAARIYRYGFFENTLSEYDYNFVAVAHNANDSTETVLLNLVRGSGIAAYHGIKIENNNIIRPLLFATRKEIEQYAKEKKIKWREDSSNNSDDYTRNKIRHHVIPALIKINPSLNETLKLHLQHMQDAEAIYQAYIQLAKEIILVKEKTGWKISIAKLLIMPAPKTILFESIREFGFSHHQVADIFTSITSTRKFLVSTNQFELIKDRKFLFLRKNKARFSYHAAIKNCGKIVLKGFSISVSEVTLDKKTKQQITTGKIKDPTTCFLNSDNIKFPLTIRTWEAGDYFCPLGMKGKKLLSDFFTDEKYSYSDKEKQLLLLTKNDVLWVVGKRIDDRFKITASTKNVLKITFNDKR